METTGTIDLAGGEPTLPAGAQTFFYCGKSSKVVLRRMQLSDQPFHGAQAGKLLRVTGREDASRVSSLVTNAARANFEMREFGVEKLFGVKTARARTVPVLPTVFEEQDERRIRMVYKEIVARFATGTGAATIKKILDKFGLAVRERNRYVPEQYVLTQPTIHYAGFELVDAANRINELPEVVFAAPNFVSEFRREKGPVLRNEQWHLSNRKNYPLQVAGEDVRALPAWSATKGDPQIIIAILDDGIDLNHPDLRHRIVLKPDPSDSKDKFGRDFFVPRESPEHYLPVPKRFRYPYDEMDGNDIHGTPCAGVAAADGAAGHRVFGVAPRCRILPVKVFHADDLASDARVADAIRYASRIARVLSCSWSGPRSPDVMLALEDATRTHSGRGALVCVATGNESRSRISFPASDPNCMAIGATTDQGIRASYSNYGDGLSAMAPSNGGVRDIFTTDVSVLGRGFNIGSAAAGGADGLYTNSFGGTSSATPLAAGVAALVLSKDTALSARDVREVLERTARRPSVAMTPGALKLEYGHGIIDASAALDDPPVNGANKSKVNKKRESPKTAAKKHK